jgi:hypothetical protein
MSWSDMLDVPRWLKQWPGHRSGEDYVVRLADDKDRPDPLELEAQRLERQKLRESPAGQARERDLLDARAMREQDLIHEQGGWVTPGEVLTLFPRVAERLAQGMAEPTMVAYGPHNEAAVNAEWQESMRRIRESTLNANGIAPASLDWAHEQRHEVPR